MHWPQNQEPGGVIIERKPAYIIILNWNNGKDTIECVRSCLKIADPNVRLLIIDNGSTDGSEDELRKRFPDIELVQTGQNLGFAEGNNVGIRHALGRGAEYVILLNNDTVVDPNFASELISAASSDPSIGMAVSKIYFFDRPDIIWYAGAKLNLKTGYTRHIGYGEKDAGQYDYIGETDRACGCSVLVTRRACETAGLLDPAYFCYVEDSDWSVRVRKAGFRIVYVPQSRVWHKISVSTGGASQGHYLYYFIRNQLMLVDRGLPLQSAMRSGLREFQIIGRTFFSLFTMRVNKMRGLKNMLLGIRDYHQGRFGRRDA